MTPERSRHAPTALEQTPWETIPFEPTAQDHRSCAVGVPAAVLVSVADGTMVR
ncbi:hypothetical protein [Sanguibacter sp. 26GB23]|uniref:hypothetical protein n=1 Tax=Sanguibacter sp. 26GB23 TaxID=3156066 RepID=UPI0032AE87CE